MLEDQIFKNYQPNLQKLQQFGFQKQNNNYYYTQKFFKNKFKARITIENKHLIGKVIDYDLGDEYLPLHSLQTGKFVNQVRSEYIDLLKKIRNECFERISIYPRDPKRYWLMPANPKFYDIMHVFAQTNTINWKQNSKIRPNDIIWLYVTSPIEAIIYQCQVLQTNVPNNYQNKNFKTNKVMRIRKIKTYSENQFTFKKLMDYGIKAILGPRHLPEKLRHDLLRNKIKS